VLEDHFGVCFFNFLDGKKDTMELLLFLFGNRYSCQQYEGPLDAKCRCTILCTKGSRNEAFSALYKNPHQHLRS
jgi:hypothetical protein